MEIEGDGYRIWYEETTSTLFFAGRILLIADAEREPITTALENLLELNPSSMRWDVTKLQLISSAGLNVLYKFILSVRGRDAMHMQVIGNEAFVWQQTALPNMKKLMPELKLEFISSL